MLRIRRRPEILTRMVVALDPSLKAVVSSCVFDLDATKSASYSGSGQTWANLVPSPADGAAQSAYHFTINGATFTGSAGDAAAYFSLNGSDNFTLAANTAFINALHKTTGGSDFWLALAYRFIQNDAAQRHISTQTSGNAVGIATTAGSNENTGLTQGNGSAAASFSSTGGAHVNGTDYVCIFSHSHSGNQSRRWLNTTTKTEGAHTFGTTTSNASGALTIGSDSAAANDMPSGTRIYASSIGNAYIDDAAAALIFAEYESRHARDYTP